MTPHAFLIMAIPAAVAVSGGVLAAVWKPSHQVRSLIQHFAAGVILAALAVELLPDIGKEHATKVVVLGAFAAGSLFAGALIARRRVTPASPPPAAPRPRRRS